MDKIIQYHFLKCPLGKGEFSIYAPKPSSEEDIKIIKRLFKIWIKGIPTINKT